MKMEPLTNFAKGALCCPKCEQADLVFQMALFGLLCRSDRSLTGKYAPGLKWVCSSCDEIYDLSEIVKLLVDKELKLAECLSQMEEKE